MDLLSASRASRHCRKKRKTTFHYGYINASFSKPRRNETNCSHFTFMRVWKVFRKATRDVLTPGLGGHAWVSPGRGLIASQEAELHDNNKVKRSGCTQHDNTHLSPLTPPSSSSPGFRSDYLPGPERGGGAWGSCVNRCSRWASHRWNCSALRVIFSFFGDDETHERDEPDGNEPPRSDFSSI